METLGNTYLSYLRLESHVQHSVGLVHDKIRAPFQIRFTHFQKVDETTRSRHADLNTTFKITQLRTLWGT